MDEAMERLMENMRAYQDVLLSAHTEVIYAKEAIKRVRELHYRFDYPTMAQVGFQQLVIKDLCHHCGDSYPCKTIRALDGEE